MVMSDNHSSLLCPPPKSHLHFPHTYESMRQGAATSTRSATSLTSFTHPLPAFCRLQASPEFKQSKRSKSHSKSITLEEGLAFGALAMLLTLALASVLVYFCLYSTPDAPSIEDLAAGNTTAVPVPPASGGGSTVPLTEESQVIPPTLLHHIANVRIPRQTALPNHPPTLHHDVPTAACWPTPDWQPKETH